MADQSKVKKGGRMTSLFGSKKQLVTHKEADDDDNHDVEDIGKTPVPILDMSDMDLLNISSRAGNDDFSDDTDDTDDDADTVSVASSSSPSILSAEEMENSPAKKRSSMFSWGSRGVSPPRPAGESSSPRVSSSKGAKALKEKIISVSELTPDEFDKLIKSAGKFDESLKESQKQVLLTGKSAKDLRKVNVTEEAAEIAKQLNTAILEKKKALKELKKLVATTGSSVLDEAAAEGIVDLDGEDSDVDDDASVTSGSSSSSSSTTTTTMGGGSSDKSALERLRHYEWKSSLLKSLHTALFIDMYYPREEGWKLRIYIPEEDMYMGAKDVGVEKLKLTCNVRSGVDGVTLEIKDLEFFTTVYQMRFKGKTSTAKALKKLMSPEMVRLGIYGSILIHADFQPKKNKWRTKKCTFDLHVNKRISGAMTAPDIIVRKLINGILPPLVRRIVAKALPPELGTYFNRMGSDVQLGLSVDVAEEITKEVWTSPLLNCEEARLVLKIEHQDVACLCAILAQGHTAKHTSLNAAVLSIQSLYTYFLKYNQKSQRWLHLLTVWDGRMRAVCGPRVGDQWMTKLFKSVMGLGRRPLNIEVRINELDLMVNIHETISLWSELYLKGIHALIKRTKQMNMPHIKFKSPEKVSQNAVELVALVGKWVGIGCEALQRAAIAVDLEVHGGRTLKASFSGRDLEVNATIPRKLQLVTPKMALDLPSLEVSSEVDESGGLGIEVVWKGQPPVLDTGDEAIEAGSGGGVVSSSGVGIEQTLVVGTVYLASLGVGLRSGKLLLTSDEVVGRVALQSALLIDLIMQEIAEPKDMNPVQESYENSTTQDQVDEAIIKFVMPLLFSDKTELSVRFNDLNVTANTPTGRPGQLEAVVKADPNNEVGRINLKLDVATILTDVLDIVELQERLWGQGIL